MSVSAFLKHVRALIQRPIKAKSKTVGVCRSVAE